MKIVKIHTIHPKHRPTDVKYIFDGETERLGEAGHTVEKGIYYEGRAGAALKQFLEGLK